MSYKQFQFIILTGPPGCGKTTVIKHVCSILKEKNFNVNGFFTEEIRMGKERIGFDVVLLDGERAPLARLKSESCHEPSVGRYAVDVCSFESRVLPLLKFFEKNFVLVLDEIGKMELLSKKFADAITKFINEKETLVLASIPARSSNSLVETIRNHPNTILLNVNRQNRDSLHEKILNFIEEAQINRDKSIKMNLGKKLP